MMQAYIQESEVKKLFIKYYMKKLMWRQQVYKNNDEEKHDIWTWSGLKAYKK